MPVYIARRESDKAIKIGFSSDVYVRLRDMGKKQNTNMVLLREIKGDRWEESWLHEKFAAKRIKGEWFKFCPKMLTIRLPKRIDRKSNFVILPATPREAFDEIYLTARSMKISVTELCRRAGVVPSTVYRWRCGSRRYDTSLYAKLTKLFGEKS